MKCDHIRTRRQDATPFYPNMTNNGAVEVCLKEDVDAAITKLNRALWLARAERARERQNYERGCRRDGWVRREDMWLEVERLCMKKAEEYK